MAVKFEFPTLFASSLSNSTPRAIQLDEPPRLTGRTWSVFFVPRIEILKIPNCGRLFLSMEVPEPSTRSRDVSVTRDNPDTLSLPSPREPLREWTEREIEPGVMIAAMESMMRLVQSQPDFEARRLER